MKMVHLLMFCDDLPIENTDLPNILVSSQQFNT